MILASTGPPSDSWEHLRSEGQRGSTILRYEQHNQFRGLPGRTVAVESSGKPPLKSKKRSGFDEQNKTSESIRRTPPGEEIQP